MLDARERARTEDALRLRAAVIHEVIRVEGEQELRRVPAALFWSGLAAGLSMGTSLLAMAVLRASLPDAAWAKLVVALGYTVGFLVVILGRQQLYTENTHTPILPLRHHRDRATLARVARLWAVVLAANLLGALAFAGVVAWTFAFSPEVKEAGRVVALHAAEGSFGSHLLRAILAGWLIALMVWMLPGAETARAFVIVLVTWLIGAAGLSHVIAGSVEVLYGVLAGVIPWTKFLGGFLAPVLLGNVIGGVSLVAALNHAQVAPHGREEADSIPHPAPPIGPRASVPSRA